MFDVFVNYRTVDARFGAASVYDALARRFGGDRVFLDHVSIRPGMEYPARINAALEQVSVLVVLIGPLWLARDPDTGARLIDREHDWVRREIRRAVQRRITIIPVLLDGVTLPAPDELPPDIRPLLHRQVVDVRHRTLGANLTHLGDSVAQCLPDRSTFATPRTARRTSRWSLVALLLLITLLPTTTGSSRTAPTARSIVGDPHTADPCSLVDASAFSRYGESEVDSAYGAFQRCDVILNPESGAEIDVEVRFDEDPIEEGLELSRHEGAIDIATWPGETQRCDRALTLPPGNDGMHRASGVPLSTRAGGADGRRTAADDRRRRRRRRVQDLPQGHRPGHGGRLRPAVTNRHGVQQQVGFNDDGQKNDEKPSYHDTIDLHHLIRGYRVTEGAGRFRGRRGGGSCGRSIVTMS